MTNRHPALVILLSLITCGLYYMYWLVSTKIEMCRLGASVPTAWLLIIPFVNIYWIWRWSQAAEQVTKGALTAVPAFLLHMLVYPIGAGIAQSYFNKTSAA
jgi:hypothetical protein